MKEIVVICLAIDAETGAIDRAAPFVVIPYQRPHRGGVYDNEPNVIAQFQPGETGAFDCSIPPLSDEAPARGAANSCSGRQNGVSLVIAALSKRVWTECHDSRSNHGLAFSAGHLGVVGSSRKVAARNRGSARH